MNAAKKVFSQNRALFCGAAVVWLAACVCGIVCTLRLDSEVFEDVRTYVLSTLTSGASVWEIVKLGISENLRFLICLLITSYAALLMPLTAALIAFKGFATGFTASVIIRIYRLKGMLISFGAVVLPFAFSMPLYFMMFVAALKFPLQKKRERMPLSPSEKRHQWLSYASMQLVLTALISAITVAEAFLMQLVLVVL